MNVKQYRRCSTSVSEGPLLPPPEPSLAWLVEYVVRGGDVAAATPGLRAELEAQRALAPCVEGVEGAVAAVAPPVWADQGLLLAAGAADDGARGHALLVAEKDVLAGLAAEKTPGVVVLLQAGRALGPTGESVEVAPAAALPQATAGRRL
eukprot:GILI01040352.1.p1 GENE.GILI01040352.1~~GILI01040352.1.p1  ORF type:complete len:150 (+),score=18.30 GILI01040352.1:59-508(+)